MSNKQEARDMSAETVKVTYNHSENFIHIEYYPEAIDKFHKHFDGQYICIDDFLSKINACIEKSIEDYRRSIS